jgi:hypothetical protein
MIGEFYLKDVVAPEEAVSGFTNFSSQLLYCIFEALEFSSTPLAKWTAPQTWRQV